MVALVATLRERLAGWCQHIVGAKAPVALSISLPLLIGALGVGAEAAVVFELRYRAQMAADAAAVAGAGRLAGGETGKVASVAQRVARRIGISSGTAVPITVTVRHPADTASVEVTVERYYVPLVARFFVSGGVPVAARSVAHVVSVGGDCVVRLVRSSAPAAAACDAGTAQALAVPTAPVKAN